MHALLQAQDPLHPVLHVPQGPLQLVGETLANRKASIERTMVKFGSFISGLDQLQLVHINL